MAGRSLFRVRALLFAGVVLGMVLGMVLGQSTKPPRTRETSSYSYAAFSYAHPKVYRRLAECADSPAYTDAGGYGCADWAGYPCEGEADSAETKKQCPKTCDACPAPVATSCSSGKFADGEACTPCLAGCLSCTNAASCTTCGSNFRFVADKTACLCEDHPTWTDANADNCAAWDGYDCAGGVALEANCPKACRKCAVPVKPVLSSVAVSSITKTGASLAATSDQNGFIYYSVLEAKASIPSAADVKTAGEATKTASTAASAATIVVSSLTAGTEYKVRRREGIVVTTRTYEYESMSMRGLHL